MSFYTHLIGLACLQNEMNFSCHLLSTNRPLEKSAIYVFIRGIRRKNDFEWNIILHFKWNASCCCLTASKNPWKVARLGTRDKALTQYRSVFVHDFKYIVLYTDITRPAIIKTKFSNHENISWARWCAIIWYFTFKTSGFQLNIKCFWRKWVQRYERAYGFDVVYGISL